MHLEVDIFVYFMKNGSRLFALSDLVSCTKNQLLQVKIYSGFFALLLVRFKTSTHEFIGRLIIIIAAMSAEKGVQWILLCDIHAESKEKSVND